MRPVSTAACLAVLAGAASAVNASPPAAAAAKRFHPSAIWQEHSVVHGDFSCRGRREVAVLGTSQTEIVVAVFLNGLSAKPELLQYPASVRHAGSAVLTTETLDFSVQDFEREVGPLPEGLRPSKTCLGLTMSDREIDAVHIYWNRKARRFVGWSR